MSIGIAAGALKNEMRAELEEVSAKSDDRLEGWLLDFADDAVGVAELEGGEVGRGPGGLAAGALRLYGHENLGFIRDVEVMEWEI